MSKLFVLIIIILLVLGFMAYKELKDDCSAIWKKDIDLFGYQIKIDAQNHTERCADTTN